MGLNVAPKYQRQRGAASLHDVLLKRDHVAAHAAVVEDRLVGHSKEVGDQEERAVGVDLV
jgi:hypothetical protein